MTFTYIHTQNNEDHYGVYHVDRVDALFLISNRFNREITSIRVSHNYRLLNKYSVLGPSSLVGS